VWLLGAAGAAALLAWTPVGAQGDVVCAEAPGGASVSCDLGEPDSQGIVLSHTLSHVGQARAYRFQVGPEAGTAHLYLGDLWYGARMSLWKMPPDGGADPMPTGPCARDRGCLAESRESGRRVLQFMQPQAIVERLEPGSYAVVVSARDDPAFDPNRRFTLRVALGPPSCALVEDPAAHYKLGLTIQPTRPARADLITFTALVSPPYSDLFDFEWQVDGQPADDSNGVILQRLAGDLPGGSQVEHHVRVTARGARPYPDPAQPSVPPTVSVECTFRVS
jgi:hypothetical protein